MNKEETERVTYEEFMTMFKFAPRMCYTLYDKAEDKITQLTNNWNELEEWLKEYRTYIDIPDFYEEGIIDCLDEVLGKMIEIQNGSDEEC